MSFVSSVVKKSKEMISEPFATGNSIIHRIDPRFKIVFAVLLSITVAVSQQFQTLGCALFFSFVLLLVTHLNLIAVARRLVVVSGFLLLIWAIVPLTFEGDLMARIGPFTIKRAGVILASQITLKSISILLLLMTLITTMNFSALGHALDRLHIPGKFVHLLLMTYRYLFVIEQEYRRLVRAAKIRGFQPGTNIHTYKTYAYFIGMLFVRAAARADRVYRAMRCRGFKGNFYCLSDFLPHRRNWVFSGFMAVFFIGLALLEWNYYPT